MVTNFHHPNADNVREVCSCGLSQISEQREYMIWNLIETLIYFSCLGLLINQCLTDQTCSGNNVGQNGRPRGLEKGHCMLTHLF